MRLLRCAALSVVVLAVGGGSAVAQVGWDTPRMIGPESPGGLGFYWLRTSALGPEHDGVMGTMALPGAGRAISLRGGAAWDADDEISAFGGMDVRTPIARHGPEQPLDLEWSAGVGAVYGTRDEGYLVVTLPMALSAGRSWSSGSIWLAPYVSLGAALDLNLGDEAPEEDFTISPAADVGIDIALDANRRFIVRVATSLGDRQALAIGLNLGGGGAG